MKKTYKQMTQDELKQRAIEWFNHYKDSLIVVYQTNDDAGLQWNCQQSLPDNVVWKFVLKNGVEIK